MVGVEVASVGLCVCVLVSVFLGAVVHGWTDRRRPVATRVGWLIGAAVSRFVVLVARLVSALIERSLAWCVVAFVCSFVALARSSVVLPAPLGERIHGKRSKAERCPRVLKDFLRIVLIENLELHEFTNTSM